MRLIFFIMPFLIGCSLFRVPKSHHVTVGKTPKEDIKKYVDKNCLSSEGIGKLEYGDKSYQFDYESVHNKKENNWSIGFYFPMLGEEILRVKYDHQKISGSLYRRIESLLVKNEKPEKVGALVDHIKASLSIGLRLISDIAKSEYASRCVIDKFNQKRGYLKFTCYDRFTGFEKKVIGEFRQDVVSLVIPFENSYEMVIEFSDWHEGKLRRSDILLRKNTWWSKFELMNIVMRSKVCS